MMRYSINQFAPGPLRNDGDAGWIDMISCPVLLRIVTDPCPGVNDFITINNDTPQTAAFFYPDIIHDDTVFDQDIFVQPNLAADGAVTHRRSVDHRSGAQDAV